MEGDQIEIPSHFLCPISLQLMKDPVTISTGITYDRESIEKWLFKCRNSTCPITKQVVLDDHDGNVIITPNHTLRRLIQSWCTLHASYGIERIPTPKQPPTVDRACIAKVLSDAKRSPQLRYTSLQRINSLLSSSSSNTRTKKLLESSGAFQYAASILVHNDDEANNLETISRREKEEALSIVAQLDDGSEGELKAIIKKNDDVLIDALIGFLRSGSTQSREQAIGLLRSVYKVADPDQLASAKLDLFFEIVNIIKDQVSTKATKCALKLLVELNPWARNRVKAVESGSVSALVDLLLDGSDRRVSEIALVVLDQLCGCAEGRADLVEHGAGLAVVSKKILRVSHVASERAVRILASISRYAATTKVLVEMVEVGVVAKLCLVMQVDCGAKTKERAKEILKLHSRRLEV
ncbi:hypothetical protein Cgig2_022473 [Carnegiea gigantea]|uniref:U-box domain-containing protein n=1 Tax=Carnegiea gigantea TaxID=171969 RepID=A0A9Q1QF79_9CARY|nr:hypothetical protein Cgig2_022473 [Carnegiea gigantea]